MALCVRLDLAVPEALHANASFEMFLQVQLLVGLFLGTPMSTLISGVKLSLCFIKQ